MKTSLSQDDRLTLAAEAYRRADHESHEQIALSGEQFNRGDFAAGANTMTRVANHDRDQSGAALATIGLFIEGNLVEARNTLAQIQDPHWRRIAETFDPQLTVSWRDLPTTADLIRETNRTTIEPRNLPSDLLPHEVARILKSMDLGLRPLAETDGWATGKANERVYTRSGELFCTFERRPEGGSYLVFSDYARKLIADYAPQRD